MEEKCQEASDRWEELRSERVDPLIGEASSAIGRGLRDRAHDFQSRVLRIFWKFIKVRSRAGCP